MVDRSDDDIEQIRRSVRLLAEVVRDVIGASRNHMHEGQFEPPDHQFTSKINHTLGRIDAVLSGLGVGDGQDGGGVDG